MGRALMAVIVLGLLAAGAWRLLRPAAAVDGDGAAPAATVTGDDGTGAAPAAPGPASRGPASGMPPAQGFSPPAAVAPAAPAIAPAALAALLRSGDARGAVAKARDLPAGAFADPAMAAAARDAALALASGGAASGPADRLQRADEARRLLARLAVEDALPLASVRERLDALNREVLFGGREIPGVLFRGTVKPGDSLDRLMRREWKGRVRAGYGVVLWLNSVPSPDRLRAGGLWVPEEPVRILVRKGTHELWVLLGGVPVRTFAVGLGMNGRTPEGEFVIEELMQRPDYWAPGGKRIPFGQKGNPLGTRWMGFRDTPEAQGFGIHGTDEPDSIGKDASQGCVRLRNEEVEQLFTWVAVGTRVEIRR